MDEVIYCDEVEDRSNPIDDHLNILVILYEADLLLFLFGKEIIDKPRPIE